MSFFPFDETFIFLVSTKIAHWAQWIDYYLKRSTSTFYLGDKYKIQVEVKVLIWSYITHSSSKNLKSLKMNSLNDQFNKNQGKTIYLYKDISKNVLNSKKQFR